MTETDAIARGAARLAKSGIPDPHREARQIWRHAMRSSQETDTDFQGLIERRAAREPMSHLLGYRDFFEHRFEVSADVLDPRPETETLVSVALEYPFSRVLDLGTGSGCILLSLLAKRPEARGIGTDISRNALNVARRNCAALEQEEHAKFVLSNWFDAVDGTFDLIVSNPPYIAAAEMTVLQPELSYEPRVALTDEADGLTAYRAITTGAASHLVPGGRLMVEIGWTQGTAVEELFLAAGFDAVDIRHDLDGRARVVSGIWPT